MVQQLLRVRVTLKGRPVRSYTFSKDCVTIGRDPGSDIFLDNAGISREHCKIELTPSGAYMLKDLGSANGVFFNDEQVKIHYIKNNDVLVVGKFTLWFVYDEDRRGEQNDARRLATTQDEGTTVLQVTELNEMMQTIRAAEAAAPPHPVEASSAPGPAAKTPHRRMRELVVLGLLLAFAAGFVVGGGLRWVSWRDALRPVAGALSLSQR